MPPKHNPLKLNPLQLRTLTLLQGMVGAGGFAAQAPDGGARIVRFPQIHGDHFHLGNAMVAAKDATGLYNEAVWNALARKGLAQASWPHEITLTQAGLSYVTGLADEIFHRSSH